jgi:tetrahydromethanopterin S-methyltransferase subunit G
MAEWTSLSVKEATRDRFNELKSNEDTSADQFLRILMDAAEQNDVDEPDMGDIKDQLDEIQRTVEQNNGALGDTVAQALEIGEHGFTDLEDRLDEIEAAAKEATQTAQATHSELEGLQ